MMRQVIFAFLLFACAQAEVTPGTEAAGRQDGYSQQYHYSSHPGGHTYAGLSFDLGTGLAIAVGAIILLIGCAALYPHGHGWSAAASDYGTYRNINIANLSEKVLGGIEKLYDAYNKVQ